MSGVEEPATPRKRFNILDPRYIIAVVQAGFGGMLLWRPNLSAFSATYLAFGNLEAWAIALLAIAAGLLLSARHSVGLMFWHLASAMSIFTISILVSLNYGPNTGTTTYFVLGWVSMLLFAKTFQHWLRERLWFGAVAARPPGWVRRREEEAPPGGNGA